MSKPLLTEIELNSVGGAASRNSFIIVRVTTSGSCYYTRKSKHRHGYSVSLWPASGVNVHVWAIERAADVSFYFLARHHQQKHFRWSRIKRRPTQRWSIDLEGTICTPDDSHNVLSQHFGSRPRTKGHEVFGRVEDHVGRYPRLCRSFIPSTTVWRWDQSDDPIIHACWPVKPKAAPSALLFLRDAVSVSRSVGPWCWNLGNSNVSPGSNSIRYERSVYYFCMLIGHDPAKDLERSQRFHLCFPYPCPPLSLQDYDWCENQQGESTWQ